MAVSPLYFDGKRHVLAFNKDTNPLGARHHLRVFDTGKTDAAGQQVWAVAASRDTKIVFNPKHPDSFFLDHEVEPNADKERDFVLRDLLKTGRVQRLQTYAPPFSGTAPSGLHTEDGRVHDLTL